MATAEKQMNHREGLAALLLRLRGYGITDSDLLEAIESVPRSQFVPAQYQDFSYSTRSLPIACGQDMFGVDQVVRAIAALDVQGGHTVLEIGTGSGYQTALLSKLAKKVTSIERYKTLVQAATKRFDALKIINITLKHGDGSNGLQRDPSVKPAVFDRIICNASFETLPKQFVDQLVSGGRMICVIGETEAPEGQMLVLLERIGNRFERKDLFPVRALPLTEGESLAL